jgi:hypothetical protein
VLHTGTPLLTMAGAIAFPATAGPAFVNDVFIALGIFLNDGAWGHGGMGAWGHGRRRDKHRKFVCVGLCLSVAWPGSLCPQVFCLARFSV